MKFRAALAASTLATGWLVAAAAPAYADLVTYCEGTGGAVTVPNDLVVPAGKTCWLDGTSIQGNVTVERSANLVITDGTIEGNARANADGYLDATGSTIAGRVRVANGYGAYFDGSELGKGVVANGANADSFLYAFDSAVAGNVRGIVGEILLDGVTAGGSVAGKGTVYVDVYDSTIARSLTVTGNENGAVICASEVDGNASYRDNSVGLQIGADGPLTTCAGPSYFGRNLDVSDNTGSIVVSDNIIRGDLSGTGNDPVPTGENNRVRGTVSGQFEDLSAPASASGPTRTLAAAPDHADELDAQVEERRSGARAEADAAGKAQL